jgi:phage baseplate assembly protein V
MSAINSLARKIRLALGRAIVKLADDTRKIQQLQVTALKNEVRSKINRYQNYGFTSNPLEGAEAVIASVGGNRSQMIVIVCDDGRHRKRNLARGEVALYTDEGDFILLKRGRAIEVVAGNKLKVNAPVSEISGDVVVGESLTVTNGATGSFTTPTGLTVTVQDGIVTNIY